MSVLQGPDSGRCPLPSFSKESVRIVRELEDLGWTFEVKRKGHAIGMAPDGVTTASVPSRLSLANRSQQNTEAILKRWRRQLAAKSEIDATARVASAMDVDTLLSGPPEDDVIEQVLHRAARKHAGKAGAELGMEAVEAAGVPEPRATVVARAPWLARQGTNRADATADLYESHAVVQVTWGDGHLSYECAREGCDYTSGNPRSVASHFRAHVRKGEQEPVPSLRPSVAKDIPIDPDSIGNGRHTHEYTPSERLVRALAHFLEAAGTTDVTALAFAALRWAHERPDLEHLEREDREPMTDGQILARIRLLVGGRDVETEEALRNALATVDRFREALDEAERMGAERIAEVEERVANLAASAQAWEQTATTEKQRADSLQEDINAWMSLAPRYGTQE